MAEHASIFRQVDDNVCRRRCDQIYSLTQKQSILLVTIRNKTISTYYFVLLPITDM